MHKVIKIIVHAHSQAEALDKAKEVLETLCGEYQKFDYFTTFDEENTTVSGRARWGNIPSVLRVDTEEGMKMLQESIKWSKQEFTEALKKIRDSLANNTDDEIYKAHGRIGGDLSHVSWTAYYCGKISNPDAWIFDNEGEPIVTHERLTDEIQDDKDEGEAYIVPADVHF